MNPRKKNAHQQTQSHSGFSRRDFLSLLAGSAALNALAGCNTQSQNNQPAAAVPENSSAPNFTYDMIGEPESLYAPPPDFQLPGYQLPAPPSSSVGPWGIIPRTAWTRTRPIASGVEPMAGIRLITFHHTGDPVPFYESSYEATAAFWERVRTWHVQGRNFGDIGYHFGIDRAGRVWQLRPLEFRGAHVRDGDRPPHWCQGNEYHGRWRYSTSPLPMIGGRYQWNDHNIGVVSIGNFDRQDPTPEQKQTIAEFGSKIRTYYNIPIYHCYTHQELVAELCPGYTLQPYMESIRRNNVM